MNPFENLKILLLLVLLTLAAFLGMGLYIYFITSPEVFLRATMKKLASLEAVEYTWQAEAIGHLIKPGTVIGGLGYSRQVNQVEGKLKTKIEGLVDLAAEEIPYTADTKTVAYNAERDKKWNVEFEQIFIDGKTYIKILRSPESEEIDLQPFVGRWTEAENDFLAQFAGWLRHDLAEQQKKDLRKLIAESEVLRFKEKLGYNFIGFTLVRGMGLEIDQEQALEFVKNYYLIAEGSGLTRSQLREVQEWIGQISEMDIEFWIGWNNKNLYRVQVGEDYEAPNGSKVKFVWILGLDGHNRKIEIEAPKGAVDYAEIMRGAGGLPTAGESESLDGQSATTTGERTSLSISGDEEAPSSEVGFRDRDNDGLYDTFEFSLGTDPTNPDTDGDGMNDGEEVKEGRNPLGEGTLFDYR